MVADSVVILIAGIWTVFTGLVWYKLGYGDGKLEAINQNLMMLKSIVDSDTKDSHSQG